MASEKKDNLKCKICGTQYDNMDDVLNCIERCKEKQAMETLPSLVVDMEWSTPQLEVMWKTVAKGTTVEEFAYFLNVAKAAGLNPFLREIFCWKDKKGNLTVMPGRDGYLIVAKRDPMFRGLQSMEICEKDTFKMAFADGAMIVEEHSINDFNDRGKIIGAWAIADFKGQSPITVFASADEYFQSSKDVWKRTPAAMMRKVPESIALKRGAGISGLVTTEEIEVPESVIVPGGIEVVDAEYVVVEPATNTPVQKHDAKTDAKVAMGREVPVSKKTPSKKRAKPAPKSAPHTEKDAVEVTGLPKGKAMLPLVFPGELSEYNISDEYQINIKQLDAAGTHFDVNNTKVWTNRNGLYYSEMAGFSMTYGRVPTDVVDAVLRFGIDKVKELHPKLDFMPYGGE